MKFPIISTALCAASISANAQNIHFIAHGISTHQTQRADGQPWNERNAGLGIRYEINSDWSIQAGQFKNSLRFKSNYLIADYTPPQISFVQAGVFAGRVSGYSQTDYAAGLVARASFERASLALRATPKFKGSPSVVALEIGWRF